MARNSGIVEDGDRIGKCLVVPGQWLQVGRVFCSPSRGQVTIR
jgi:hypothetical protein